MTRPHVSTYLWHETLHHEWICEELNVLITRCDDGWYVYPFQRDVRLGPFSSLAEAQREAEAQATRRATDQTHGGASSLVHCGVPEAW